MALLLLQQKQRVEAALENASFNFVDNIVELDGAFVLIDDEGNAIGDVDLPEMERQMLEVLRSKNQVDLANGDVLCVIPDPATVANRAAFAAQPYAVLLVEELLVNNAAAVRFVGATSNDGDANAIAATTAVATAALRVFGSAPLFSIPHHLYIWMFSHPPENVGRRIVCNRSTPPASHHYPTPLGLILIWGPGRAVSGSGGWCAVPPHLHNHSSRVSEFDTRVQRVAQSYRP